MWLELDRQAVNNANKLLILSQMSEKPEEEFDADLELAKKLQEQFDAEVNNAKPSVEKDEAFIKQVIIYLLILSKSMLI